MGKVLTKQIHQKSSVWRCHLGKDLKALRDQAMWICKRAFQKFINTNTEVEAEESLTCLRKNQESSVAELEEVRKTVSRDEVRDGTGQQQIPLALHGCEYFGVCSERAERLCKLMSGIFDLEFNKVLLVNV